MNSMITIGRVAKLSGVNVQTVRYYERRNLLIPDFRKKLEFSLGHLGYRLYREDAVKKIRFIKNAQELGFTLREISSLLSLRVGDKSSCGVVKKRTESKLHDVREKIMRLKGLEKILKELIEACDSCGPRADIGKCPVIRSLDVQYTLKKGDKSL